MTKRFETKVAVIVKAINSLGLMKVYAKDVH